MKKFILAFSIVLLATLVASSTEASHSWGPYHWARSANPLSLKLGDNLSSTSWKAHLATASTDWTASSVLDTAIVLGTALRHRSSQKDCSPVNGTVQVCNKTYGNNGWLGLAQIWISGSHITQGVAKMNDTYFNLAKYNNPNEKLHVVCQEVGHTFGLDHQSEDGTSQNTCMDYFSNTGANAESTLSTHPNAHDYAQLETIYAHLDVLSPTPTTKNGNGNGNGNIIVDLNDPSAWGKAVRQDARGNNSLYELDLGNGNKLFTFVTWAE